MRDVAEKSSGNLRWWLTVASIALLMAPTIAQAQGSSSPLRQTANAIAQKILTDPGVADLKGKSLIVAEFRDTDDNGRVEPRVLQSMLVTAFIEGKHFKVVERERIDLAMQELKLDASGLVDPGKQKQLGKFLGADLMLVGEIARPRSEPLSFDSRLVSIESLEAVASAAVTWKGSGGGYPPFSKVKLISWNLGEATLSSEADNAEDAQYSCVEWLLEKRLLAPDISAIWRSELKERLLAHPEKYVIRTDPRSDAYYVRMDLSRFLRDVVGTLFGNTSPRIAVCTTESVIQRPVPDPAVATALSSALLKYGFQVVDSEQCLSALAREQSLQSGTGDEAAIKALGAELKADIILRGESFAQEHSNSEGFDARVEFTVVEAATGRTLASISETKRVNKAPSPLVAAKSALQIAAEDSSLRMCAEMLNAYGKPENRLRVWRVRSFDDRTKILKGLKQALRNCEVTPISMDLRAAKSALFSVTTKQTVDDIAEALKSIRGIHLEVTGLDCRSIVCEVR